MSLSHLLRNVLTNDAYSCSECGFAPKNDETFTNVGSVGDKLNRYECPDCEHQFDAALCECGRGYGSLAAFDPRDIDRTGNKNDYHCACGEPLFTSSAS